MSSFVRITYVVPRDGQGARVMETLKKLSDFYVTQPGYLGGYQLNPLPTSASNACGRIGIWASMDAAENAAQTEHVMALRAELLRLVDEDTHVEYTFVGDPDPMS